LSSEEPIPFKFVDSVDTRKHIALFYQESEYARLIEFRFLKNGLMRGEQCVYATGEDSGAIVLKMLSYGIPFEYLESKKLRVLQLHDGFTSREQILENSKKNMQSVFAGLKSPFRIVSRIISDVNTLVGMSIELELEKKVHQCIGDLGGSVMCPYDLSKIESSRRKEWLKEIRENHHETIYAPKFGHGGVLSNKDQF
jgi:DcmR-like sensory protein